MKQSQLFTRTQKDIGEEEKSLNASLLIRAGFIDKLAAGVYSYLPLGLRVLKKIENIIREEMNAIDAQELLMPALSPKQNWEATKRWDGLDVLFKLQGHDNKEYALGATHEEVVTPLMKRFVFSYKDLPQYVYQIQFKFRNEARAKSGLLRGREFLMKDLYSFHTSEKDLEDYYQKATEAYYKVCARLGLKDLTYLTYASGGTFSKYSHEFQTKIENGEDLIYICPKCNLAYNKEIIDEIEQCAECKTSKNQFKEETASEIGNIFKLGSKYSNSFGFKYVDDQGQEQDIIMGCYGIGVSRAMGILVEVFNDDKGIIWPISVAPYHLHLISLGNEDKIIKEVNSIYKQLVKDGYEVLYDDRDESAGIKLNDSDLIGLPYRLVVSEKTLKEDSVEIKKRSEKDFQLIKIKDLSKYLQGEIKLV